MKLIKHPHVVRLYEVVSLSISTLPLLSQWYKRIYIRPWTHTETHNFLFLHIRLDYPLVMIGSYLQVMGSKTKIYIVLEFVTGGELFDKIVSSSFLLEFGMLTIW